MDRGLKEPNTTKGGDIEGVLKGLHGKTLTKKSIFDLLLGINLDGLSASKEVTTQKKEEVHDIKPAKREKEKDKKRKKKNKQEELSRVFDLVTAQITPSDIQEHKLETNSTSLVELEYISETIPESISDVKLGPIVETIDISKSRPEEQEEEISVVLYPIGNKKPNNTKPTEPIEIKCKACKKTFTAEGSLRRHHRRFPVCVDFMALPESADNVKIDRGLHYILDELLSKSVSLNGVKECRWCKTTFTNIGNLHKHLNTSKVCNKMSIQEFKRLFLSLEV